MSHYECPICGSDVHTDYIDMCQGELNKLKSDAVREAARSCGRYLKASALNGLHEYADKLERGEI